MSTNAALTETAARTSEKTLREVIEALAPIERKAGSEGERQAAEWIAERLTAAGAPARVETAAFRGDFAGVNASLAALGAASGVLASTSAGRRIGALGGALAAALLAIGKLYFGAAQVDPALPGTAALGAASVLGRAGLWLAVGGMFFAFAGASIETAMCSAYNLAQFFGWTWGKYRTARGAPRFALSWIIVFVLATLVVLTGVDPIKVVEYSIVFSVVILPLTYFPMMAISRDPDTMGVHRNGWISNTLGWIYFVIVCIAAVAAIPLLVLTHGGQG
jgi:hypothetical protein